MAQDPDDIDGRAPDPFVRARITDPGEPPPAGTTLFGLLGDSDRPGRRRLYLNLRLDYYVEFRTADVVGVDAIPPERPPFVGLDATRVSLRPDASVDWVRRRPLADAFAVDARSADRTVQPEITETWQARCPTITEHFGRSDVGQCRPRHGGGHGTFGPLPTPTRDGGATCATCDQGTCVTCGEGTCWTCHDPGCPSVGPTCGGATCRGCTDATCRTCGTCVSCASCVATCEGTCMSCRGTCDGSCAGGCGPTNGCPRATEFDTCPVTCETCHTCPDLCYTRFLDECAISSECYR